MPDIEYRDLPVEGMEARSDEGGMEIRGYAAVFEKLSEPLFGFREKIQKGAFADSLKRNDVKAFWNHNPDYVLGSTRNGTLRLAEDDTGLRFELKLPDTSWGRDAYESIRRGDVEGVSFGFRTEKERWEGDAKNPVRTLIGVRLFEISPTPIPAYRQTSVSARSAQQAYEEYQGREVETGRQALLMAQRKRQLDLIEKETV